jgi:hypothetical protein
VNGSMELQVDGSTTKPAAEPAEPVVPGTSDAAVGETVVGAAAAGPGPDLAKDRDASEDHAEHTVDALAVVAAAVDGSTTRTGDQTEE